MDRALLIANMLEPPRPGAELFQHLSGRGFLTITGERCAQIANFTNYGVLLRIESRALSCSSTCQGAAPSQPPPPHTHRPLPGDPSQRRHNAHGHGQHGLCRARVRGGCGRPDGGRAPGHLRRAAAARAAGGHAHCKGRRRVRQVRLWRGGVCWAGGDACCMQDGAGDRLLLSTVCSCHLLFSHPNWQTAPHAPGATPTLGHWQTDGPATPCLQPSRPTRS